MSRYPPSEYRASRERDRSRSPPRFLDRRASAHSIFERPPGPPRNASDAPRGPRSHFDAPRAPPSGGPGPGAGQRPGYSLRDAPPLGSNDRGRPFRDRDYDRRDRPPSPRERSPPRPFKDPRDYPPRDLDINRARRASRDGPPSAGSTFSDTAPFASTPFRGGFARGRGRGEFEFRGGRGGRRGYEDHDLMRRDRSPPPPRWGRDLSRDSRDGREPERRDDRRFERREDDRRPEWADRERDTDRSRREQPAPRLEARNSNDTANTAQASQQKQQQQQQPPPSQPQQQPAPAAPPIDPGRLALLASAGADLSVRRPSVQQNAPPPQARREVPETPSYLNGRAETTANRYNQRGSSPPTQAPPVPAFTLSFAPPTSAPGTAGSNLAPTSSAASVAPKSVSDVKAVPTSTDEVKTQSADPEERPQSSKGDRPVLPPDTPTAPKAPPAAPKAHLAEPPLTAPKAPRALEGELQSGPSSRLHGIRSFENLNAQSRIEPLPRTSPNGPLATSSSAVPSSLSTLTQPVTPNPQAGSRLGEFTAPTGPRAARMSPAQIPISPRPPFASPRSEAGANQIYGAVQRGSTPPPLAPSGPRNRSFSVSPKVSLSSVPTAPKAIRAPPVAPRAVERAPAGPGRAPDRLNASGQWAPPAAPRNLQWNQWRRPPGPGYNEWVTPAKREFSGEEKESHPASKGLNSAPDADTNANREFSDGVKIETASKSGFDRNQPASNGGDRMDVDTEGSPPKTSTAGHSAAQSFFGKPVDSRDDDRDLPDVVDEPLSSSEDDETDYQEELALFNAKYERNKRKLESQLVDLSGREYRATTPLESIARLSRISDKDLQRLSEHQEMEMDESPTIVNNHLVPPATRSTDSEEDVNLATPKGEDDARVAVRGDEYVPENIRSVRKLTPEVISLPFLMKDAPPFHQTNVMEGERRQHESSLPLVTEALRQQAEDENAAEEDIEMDFAEQYRRWREECEDLDREREQSERVEPLQAAEPIPEPDAVVTPSVNPIVEGRRLHKFSSEYDIELVIKQSEETARIEQEKQDRENLKLQADMEKEARLPDQQTEESYRRSVFIDTNRLRDPTTLTQVFSYEPPVDTFTEKEAQIFVGAFKETPKKWGEIASLLPGRSYRHCIHHYYANKWDGRFRDKKRGAKTNTSRRGRGGKPAVRGKGSALMADLGRRDKDDIIAGSGVSDSGRPKRAAAPTTFGERESEAKAALMNPSPAKRMGPGAKQDPNGDNGSEKPPKKRRGNGEKPGRKAKSNQPLAALAAAPTGSPVRQFMPSTHAKDDLVRAQNLEDASLLAGLQSGHHGFIPGDNQAVYHQDSYIQPSVVAEDSGRSKAIAQATSSKPSASSYWSVPEQTDFAKYIAHFGTDFAAIAAHMGTKTQTMIKNHYQRQIDGGTRPELQMAAKDADRRRELGEDMGAPPTPTPIIKRKYDNPPATAPRPLAPHTDAMDIDEPMHSQRPATSKHASPQQFQTQPRFTSSAQATPVQAARVVQSPVPANTTPMSSQAQSNASARPMQQHPMGTRIAFLSDTRPESRPALQATPSFRLSQDSLPRSTSQQPTRETPDAQFISNLRQEQDRALRMQQEQSQQERMDQMLRQSSMHRGSAQGSPAIQPLPHPHPERKPMYEERAPTPPRNTFPQSSLSRAGSGQPMSFAPLGQMQFSSSLAGRPSFNPSPPKREDLPHGPMSVAPPSRPSTVTAPPPEPPKRSNLLSILNSEPEEPKPPKRESIPSAPLRNASPAPSMFQSAPTPGPPSNISSRRETFGQPSIPQSQFGRSSFAPPIPNKAPGLQTLKREPSSGAVPSAQSTKQDWTSHIFGPPSGSSQPSPPSLERERVPPFFPHRAMMGSLNQPTRGNPSPPPRPVIGHSRTPSLTTQPSQPPREQRPSGVGQQQQHAGPQPTQPLQSNPYASQTGSSLFSQHTPLQAQTHAHHSHNNSLGGAFPPLHQRAHSREDDVRQQEQQAFAAMREREREREDDWRRRQQRQDIEIEQRQRDLQYHAQRQQEQERQQQQQQQSTFSRGPPAPQPLQPPAFGGPGPSSGFGRVQLGLREQSMRETEAAMEEQQLRLQQQEADRRRHDLLMRDREQEEEFRRRQQDLYQRRTPMNGSGGYGLPPPRR